MAIDTPPNATAVKQRAIRGGAVLMVVKLLAQIFQWSVTVFVARLLVADDYGMMTLGMLFVEFADRLAEAGIGRALVQKKDLTQEDLNQGVTWSLALAGLFYTLLFLLAEPAAVHFEREEFTPFLRILAMALLLTPWRSVAEAVIERDLRLEVTSSIHFVAALSQTCLVLAMAAAGFGFWALACGTLLARVLETALVVIAARRSLRLVVPTRAAAPLLRFGLQYCGATLLWFLYANADFAAVGSLLGTQALGLYSLAFQLISLPVQKISLTSNTVMFAVYCKLQDDRARLRDWYVRLCTLQSFVALPALLGLGLVAADAIPLLLGDQWQRAVLPLQLLCPVGAIMIVASPLTPLLNAIGRPDVMLKYTAVSAVLYPAAFSLAAQFGFERGGVDGGLLAVCLVWLMMYPLLVAGLYLATRRVTQVAPLDLLRAHLPILLGLACMAAGVTAVQALLREAPAAARLSASIAVGAATYAAWILATARQTILHDVWIVWAQLRGRPET